MKKILFTILFFSALLAKSQEKPHPFKAGEYLRYKMSYSGFLKAGTAVLELRESEINGEKVFHSVGKGWTAAVIGWFFKVEDTYQTFFNKKTTEPYLFKRDVYEGGYTIKRETKFDYSNKKAIVQDFKDKTTKEFEIGQVQDMLSAFYFLRTQNTDSLQPGDDISLNMFFDKKSHPFKLKFIKEELLKTRFGKIKTLVFKPLVQAGRVFKENESVTIWITADDNKIPIKLHASLSVGSLRAELQRYKGLANPFEIIFD